MQRFLNCDTHVHSCRSFVGAPNMTLENISAQAEALGIDVVAITDHLMKPEDLDDLRVARDMISRFQKEEKRARLLFGVEVCEVGSDGATLLTKAIAEELGFEVIIGGVHETHMLQGASLLDMAYRQHRHHLMMMENPLIDILVHPWWLDAEEFEKLGIAWPADMSFIPEELTAALGRASRQTGTYIEISTMSGLCNRGVSAQFREDYLDYYRVLNREGALFAIGTDTHELSEMETFSTAVSFMRDIGIDEDRLWQPGKNITR